MGIQYELLGVIFGWIIAAGIGGLWAIVLAKIITNRIDLAKLIADTNGGASMSRFQLLVFTFVIATSLFFITFKNSPPALPDVPANILALLGISASSYVVSKAIQTGAEAAIAREKIRKGKPADIGRK